MTATAGTLRTLESSKLGSVAYGPDDVIRFTDGLPGFEGLREFLVVTREECAPFVFLASLADDQVALPLLPLAIAAGRDAERLAHEAAAALEEREGRSALPAGLLAAYAVVVIGPDAREVVVNLRAPVVVDLDNRRGAQVILSDDGLPVAAPLGA